MEKMAMVDFNKLVGSITGSGIGSGLAGGLAGGALVSAMTTKSGRKAATSVAKIGGLAAVGALAWGAYKKYQDNSAPAEQVPATGLPATAVPATAVPATAVPATAVPATAVQSNSVPEVWQQLPQQQFDVLASGAPESQGLLVLRTMISAAMADGHLGPDEQTQIFERLDSLGLSAEERSTLFDELRNPMACNVLAAQVTDPVIAIEMYTAATMTVDGNCLTAREFLRQLSTDLNLPEPLVASIHSNTRDGQLLASA
jgi:uncharacterized membrane protein YebE (DUF533 family)